MTELITPTFCECNSTIKGLNSENHEPVHSDMVHWDSNVLNSPFLVSNIFNQATRLYLMMQSDVVVAVAVAVCSLFLVDCGISST